VAVGVFVRVAVRVGVFVRVGVRVGVGVLATEVFEGVTVGPEQDGVVATASAVDDWFPELSMASTEYK
jgi:hypothetical protein